MRAITLLLAVGLPICGSALAQKYPSTSVPPSMPIPPPPRAAVRPAPAPASPPAPAGSTTQQNPAAEQLSQSLPIDPATREMRDRLPSDIREVERMLGLRESRAPRIDLRRGGRAPTATEIADALAPR